MHHHNSVGNNAREKSECGYFNISSIGLKLLYGKHGGQMQWKYIIYTNSTRLLKQLNNIINSTNLLKL